MKNLFYLILVCALLSGCSYRTWYAGFVEGQRYQCNKLDGSERQSCMEAIITDYDRYQRERDAGFERDKN